MAKSSGSAMRGVALGWSLFAGTHLALSHPPVREEAIARMGEGPFKGAYSLVSFATFIPTTLIYARSAAGKGVIPIWTNFSQTRAAKTLGLGFKAAGAVTLSQSISTPNTVAGTMDPSNLQKAVEVKGIERITRHPMFTSFALLGLGNMLTRGHAGDVIYWAGFPLFWFIGCSHQDSRLRSVLPAEFYETTSLVPFGAILEGRNSLRSALEEFNRPAALAALVAPLFFL